MKGIAKNLDLSVVKNSGAGWQKTDAKDERICLEHKYTDSNSFAITMDLLFKLCEQTWQSGRTLPLFAVTFTKANRMPKDWVLVPLDKVKDIIDEGLEISTCE